MPAKNITHIITTLVTFCLLLSACAPQATIAAPTAVPPSPTAYVSNIPVDYVTSTPSPIGVHLGDAVPASLRGQVQAWDIPASSYLALDVSTAPATEDETRLHWVYALVAPFPTITDGVTSDELLRAWMQGTAPAPFNGAPLLMEDSTLAAFTAIWGAPAPGGVRSVPADQLLETAWRESASWAIIPFESLEPKWKVLTVEGLSPIRKNFDSTQYPLVVPFTLQTSPDLQPSAFISHPSNYDPSKLTTVIMTGVTALVRATALTMDVKGLKYPGEKIRDVMLEADIAHVSNEIPFYSGCPSPNPNQTALVFCSDPRYIELLTDIGTDVIELTGNHFADRGAKGMVQTIDIYNENNLPYFGGGLDLQDSLKPALFEVNGNRIAFIGCNRPDTGNFPTATDSRPGAAPCDFAYLKEKVAQLKSEGFVVISTFQWNESYDHEPHILQIKDFQFMVDAGADIVSGSQAHYAQRMEFYKDSFIHYGLGNLFFDQMGDQAWMPKGIRREFLDRYVVYDGKFISAELLTALLEDYSRPRLMTDTERAKFLKEYFYYSGWISLEPTQTPTITPTLTPLPLPSTPDLLPLNTPSPGP
jgi:poly-gamma-glutamate synthesis protein (capsule biosynthesis protein)